MKVIYISRIFSLSFNENFELLAWKFKAILSYLFLYYLYSNIQEKLAQKSSANNNKTLFWYLCFILRLLYSQVYMEVADVCSLCASGECLIEDIKHSYENCNRNSQRNYWEKKFHYLKYLGLPNDDLEKSRNCTDVFAESPHPYPFLLVSCQHEKAWSLWKWSNSLS